METVDVEVSARGPTCNVAIKYRQILLLLREAFDGKDGREKNKESKPATNHLPRIRWMQEGVYIFFEESSRLLASRRVGDESQRLGVSSTTVEPEARRKGKCPQFL